MGNKGKMPNFGTIDDYIAHQPKESQGILKDLRSVIREAVPNVVEIPNNKVPLLHLFPVQNRLNRS